MRSGEIGKVPRNLRNREGNTPKEMTRKLDEYFRAGVRLVWYGNPKKRTVSVYTAPDHSVSLGDGETLDGGGVLPGFSLSIREWFGRAERTGPQ
jgi:Uma2 family endonuclease